jgi:hypothetical protein
MVQAISVYDTVSRTKLQQQDISFGFVFGLVRFRLLQRLPGPASFRDLFAFACFCGYLGLPAFAICLLSDASAVSAFCFLPVFPCQ